jgi:hypothetical protein
MKYGDRVKIINISELSGKTGTITGYSAYYSDFKIYIVTLDEKILFTKFKDYVNCVTVPSSCLQKM